MIQNNRSKLITLFDSPKVILALLILISCAISLLNIQLGLHDFWGGSYTYYNNYVIFKSSFGNLIHQENLYVFHPEQYADLYKYSPTFSVFMSLFYYLPDYLGLCLWNALNVVVLYKALQTLSAIHPRRRHLLFLFLSVELFVSIQNSQSNILLAGLCIWAFGLLEKNKTLPATFLLALGTFIKIYSVLGALLLLLYPNRIKSILQFGVWSVLLFLLPLLLIPFAELMEQYSNWASMLQEDQQASIGMSVYAYSQFIFPASHFKILTLILGVILLIAPLLKWNSFRNENFRLNYLTMVLIWMVIFNYKAESPTYVIALSGIGLWYFAKTRNTTTETVLLLLSLLFTSLWVTDLIPREIKNEYLPVNYMKTLFPMILFFVIWKNCIGTKNLNVP
jgi:hypothetical protein